VTLDHLYGLMVCFSVGVQVGMLIWPALAPTWYPRVLRAWGRRRGVRVDFVLGPGLRLREGPEVEAALGRLYVRLVISGSVGLGAFGLSMLLLLHGPHLSESTANSWVVAGLPTAATVFALFRLQGFTDPYRTEGGRTREATVEDYVWPAVRVAAWFAAGAAALVPVAFGVLAAGPSYDADKVFWEGVVGHPLTGVLVVVLTERWLHRITDVAEPDDPTLYVWDCLRTRAVQLLYVFAFMNLVLGFSTAGAVLNGVAQVGPEPAWLDRASALCWLLQLIATLGVILVFVQPVAARLRARLWPGLPPAEPIEFGRALPIP
jgi:hypothetical protein